MSAEKNLEIKLLVNDKCDLYTPISPDSIFTSEVKNYIRSKIISEGYSTNFSLRVLCKTPIDEERFRAAVADWIQEERGLISQEAKSSGRLMLGLLAAASLFIIVSLALEKHFSVLSYTIIPVLGTVALSRAAGMFITDIPVNNAKLKMLDEIVKNNKITFEQLESEQKCS